VKSLKLVQRTAVPTSTRSTDLALGAHKLKTTPWSTICGPGRRGCPAAPGCPINASALAYAFNCEMANLGPSGFQR